MPIVRTYACEACNHFIEVTLTMEQCDNPPPECPACAARAMQQQFKPIAITGSPSARAHAVTEDILDKDYHVADFEREPRAEGTPKVRYKDAQTTAPPSTWTAATETIAQGIAAGREQRLRHGSGLDVLQANLKSGAEPDLIEISKRRAMRVY